MFADLILNLVPDVEGSACVVFQSLEAVFIVEINRAIKGVTWYSKLGEHLLGRVVGVRIRGG